MWQPIETAPKDGTPILVHHKVYRRTVIALWQDGFVHYQSLARHEPAALPSDGWDPRIWSDWMPLPAAPARASDKEASR